METFWTILIITLIAGIILTFNDRSKNRIICPNQSCRFKGVGQAKGGKSLLLFIILFIIGIIPGLLYAVWPVRKQLICPKCGMQIR